MYLKKRKYRSRIQDSRLKTQKGQDFILQQESVEHKFFFRKSTKLRCPMLKLDEIPEKKEYTQVRDTFT